MGQSIGQTSRAAKSNHSGTALLMPMRVYLMHHTTVCGGLLFVPRAGRIGTLAVS